MTDAVTVSDEKLADYDRRLREECTDWNGEPLPDDGPTRTYLSVGEARTALALVSELQQRREREGEQEPVAWQWSDFSGLWYTVDTARGTLADQEAIARMAAEKHEGRLRPLFAFPTSPTEVKALREALKPFAEFAENVDEHGWTSSIHEESISTWFGPSDFRAALLASNEVGKCGPEAKFAALAVPIGVLLTAVYFVGKHRGWWP